MILCQTHTDDANHAGSFRLALTHFRLARNVIELVPLTVGTFQDTLGTEHLSAFRFVLDGFQSRFNLLSAVFVSGGNTEFIEHFVRIVAVVVMMVVTAAAFVVMVVIVVMFVLMLIVIVVMFVMAAASVFFVVVIMFFMVMVIVVMVMLATALVIMLLMVMMVMVLRLVLFLFPMCFF